MSGEKQHDEQNAGESVGASSEPALNDDSRPAATDVEQDTSIGKRPFCRGTGYTYQVVGFFLAFSTCCVWPAAYWWQDAADVRAVTAETVEAVSSTENVLTTIGVALSFLGGMGLIVVGLGLQQDRFRTGRWALFVTTVPMVYQWTYFVLSIMQFPTVGRVVVGGTLALMWTAMFVLAGVSADELRKDPPTPSELGWTSIDEDDLQKVLSLRSRDRTNR